MPGAESMRVPSRSSRTVAGGRAGVSTRRSSPTRRRHAGSTWCTSRRRPSTVRGAGTVGVGWDAAGVAAKGTAQQTAPVLSTRALNRALLARQLLLERAAAPPGGGRRAGVRAADPACAVRLRRHVVAHGRVPEGRSHRGPRACGGRAGLGHAQHHPHGRGRRLRAVHRRGPARAAGAVAAGGQARGRAGHAGRRGGRAALPGRRPADPAPARGAPGGRRVPEGRVGGRPAVGRPAARAAGRNLGEAAGAPVRARGARPAPTRPRTGPRRRRRRSCWSRATCARSGPPPPRTSRRSPGSRSARSGPCWRAATCGGSAARRAGSWSTCRTGRCRRPARRRRCASWAPGTPRCSCTRGAPSCCRRPTGPRVFATSMPRSVPTFLVDGQVAGTWAYAGGQVVTTPVPRPVRRRTAAPSTRRPSGSRRSTRPRVTRQGRRTFVVADTRARSSASWRSPS